MNLDITAVAPVKNDWWLKLMKSWELLFVGRFTGTSLGWNSRTSFYFDGTGFIYKKNPLDQAHALGATEWRMRPEGLTVGCTAREKKEGNQQVHFLLPIAYGKGAVMCIQYQRWINGPKFAILVREDFPSAFEQSANAVQNAFFRIVTQVKTLHWLIELGMKLEQWLLQSRHAVQT